MSKPSRESFCSSLLEPIPFDPQYTDGDLLPVCHERVKDILHAVDVVLRLDDIPNADFMTSACTMHHEVAPALSIPNESMIEFLMMMNPLLNNHKRKADEGIEHLTGGSYTSKRQRIREEEQVPYSRDDTASLVSSDDTSACSEIRFRQYQSGQWLERFRELVNFRQARGHCFVPHNWQENPRLAQWVKRQRYQYRLKKQGKNSTITEEREDALNNLGFVWDSHSTIWEERFSELLAFKAVHMHCNVPTVYLENQSLAIWVKCQRRQHALFTSGQKRSTTMTLDRIARLTEVGFSFNPRNLTRRK